MVHFKTAPLAYKDGRSIGRAMERQRVPAVERSNVDRCPGYECSPL
jgi:hypothetical protein